MYTKSAIAGALLAAAPIVNAVGSATISNKCNFPVYMWTVSAESSAMRTINAGGEFTEGYLTNPNGGGVSMKIATSPSTAGAVTQFEYTMDSTLWYDLSNINGWPFEKWGATLLPSVSSCRSVLCAAGVELCSQAYNQPDENWATAACSTEADMTLVLCSAQQDEKTPSPLALSAHNDSQKHKHHHHHNAGANINVDAAAAPPAPAVTPAPAPAPAPAAADGAMTTLVTQIVTVTARNAEPSVAAEQPVRRHMHHHHHNHHA